MRISTIQIFKQGLSNILNQQNEMVKAQVKIATGKRIQQPSDDPVGVARIQVIQQDISLNERYQNNINSARSALNQEENVLATMGETLQRIRELYIQANNSSLSHTARENLVVDLEHKLDQLSSYANYKDVQGNYIFSGHAGHISPIIKTAGGTYVYQGDEGQRSLEITNSISLPINDPGTDIFARLREGNGYFKITDPDPANTGTGIINSSEVADKASYIEDAYVVNFIDNAGTMIYEVRDSANALVSSGHYIKNQAIEFNGIQIQVSGEPNDADNFQLIPSQHTNLFNSIATMLNTLRNLSDNPVSAAIAQTQMGQRMIELDAALEALSNTRSVIGARLNSLDASESVNEDMLLVAKQLISSIEDIDLTQAIMDLNKSTTALQAMQQSFVRISNLNLFNLL